MKWKRILFNVGSGLLGEMEKIHKHIIYKIVKVTEISIDKTVF